MNCVTYDEVIGMIVAVRRKALAVRQSVVVAALGLSSQSAVSRYERGQYGFTLSQLDALTGLLLLDFNEIVRVYRVCQRMAEEKGIVLVHRRSGPATVGRMELHSLATKALAIVVPLPVKVDHAQEPPESAPV